jgi:glycolate oxidase FAD binding subunit
MDNSIFEIIKKNPNESHSAFLERTSNLNVDGMLPSILARPRTVDQIAEVLNFASENCLSVLPSGGGTKRSLGNIPNAVDILMDLSCLHGLVTHEPSDLTATFLAGTSLTDVQSILSGSNQFLPLESPIPSRATLGGILSVGMSGSNYLRYGLPRDWVLGVKVVNADSSIIKVGGQVVKNVTGYDLTKMYVGSLGTLGVIAECTFKLAPKPKERMTRLIYGFDNIDSAIQVMDNILEDYGLVRGLVLIDQEVESRLDIGVEGYAILVLIDGTKRTIRANCESLNAFVGHHKVKTVGDHYWQQMLNLGWIENGRPVMNILLRFLPSQLKDVLDMVNGIQLQEMKKGLIADPGIGKIRLFFWGELGAKRFHKIISTIAQISSTAEPSYEYLIEHCPVILKKTVDIWGQEPDALELMMDIKNELDPKKVLNPGRFVGGI